MRHLWLLRRPGTCSVYLLYSSSRYSVYLFYSSSRYSVYLLSSSARAGVMLTYADVCWRMLTYAYADVCWRMLCFLQRSRWRKHQQEASTCVPVKLANWRQPIALEEALVISEYFCTSKASELARTCLLPASPCGHDGARGSTGGGSTRITCFTSAKVQILTPDGCPHCPANTRAR